MLAAFPWSRRGKEFHGDRTRQGVQNSYREKDPRDSEGYGGADTPRSRWPHAGQARQARTVSAGRFSDLPGVEEEFHSRPASSLTYDECEGGTPYWGDLGTSLSRRQHSRAGVAIRAVNAGPSRTAALTQNGERTAVVNPCRRPDASCAACRPLSADRGRRAASPAARRAAIETTRAYPARCPAGAGIEGRSGSPPSRR